MREHTSHPTICIKNYDTNKKQKVDSQTCKNEELQQKTGWLFREGGQRKVGGPGKVMRLAGRNYECEKF